MDRSYLPSFVARSRAHPERELKDAELWAAMWAAALRNASSRRRLRVNPVEVEMAEAQVIPSSWLERVPSPESWLALDRELGVLDSLVDWGAQMRRRLAAFAHSRRR